MKKIIFTLIILMMCLVGLSNAGDRDPNRFYHKNDMWGNRSSRFHIYLHDGYRGSETYHRGIISGEELRRPMGHYKLRGYIGGYKVNPDGSVDIWSKPIE